LKSHALANADACRYVLDRFRAAGIDKERVELRAFTTTLEEHFGAYSEIDIALDTFPYNGTTTTCEALWMGVPVVTQAGSLHAARVGASILTRIGQTDMITASEKDYIETAVRLAGDLRQLEYLRLTLREKLAGSPLCNAANFTASLEAAFRNMWRNWCTSSVN
jgi:protein O-GlcNAc transferase